MHCPLGESGCAAIMSGPSDKSNSVLYFIAGVLQWAWMFSVYRLVDICTQDAARTLTIPLILFGLATVVIAVCLNGSERFKVWLSDSSKRRRYLIVAASVVGSLGDLLVHNCFSAVGPLAVVFVVIGCVLTAFACIVLDSLLWMSFRDLDVYQPQNLLAISLVPAIALDVLMRFLFPDFQGFAIFPLVIGALLWHMCKQLQDVQTEKPDKRTFKYVNKSAIHNLLIGVSLGAFILIYPGDLIQMDSALLAVIALVIALAGYLLAGRAQIDNPEVAIFQIDLPLMACSWLVLCLPLPIELAYVLQLVGVLHSFLVENDLFGVMVQDYSCPITAEEYSWGFLPLGIAIGLAIQSIIPHDIELLPPIALAVFLFVALLLFRNRKISFGWTTVETDTSDLSEETFHIACVVTGEEGGLTKREQEIFERIALGQNRSSIARDLVISEETVKSHTKNIYRKLDAHSQMEIVSIVREKSWEITKS